MKKILLLSFFFCCFYFTSNKTFAQIGYKFDASKGSNVISGDLKSFISNNNTLTYEFWANRTGGINQIFASIMCTDIIAGGFGFIDNRMAVSLASNFGIGYTQSTILPANSINAWHHYAYVFNAGRWNFYYDGALVGGNLPDQEGSPRTPDYKSIGATFLYVGSQSDQYANFDGSMDDIRIWSTARTATEILNSKNNELTGTQSGLVAYYKLNEQTGQVVIDNGPNGLNGILGITSSVEAIDPLINQVGIVTGYPAAATTNATAITASTATLHGTLNANGNTTTTSFDYGTSPTLAGSSSIAGTPATVSAGAGTTNVTADLTGLNPSTTYYYRAKGLNSAGTTTGDILNFTTQGLQPSLTIINSITAPFITTYGTASASQSFTVSGTNLTAAVLITPPAGGFELSPNNITFSPTLTIGAAGMLATTTVYMRLKANTPASAGVFSGSIQFSSGAINSSLINLLPNNIVNKAPLTITVNNMTKVYGGSLTSLSASYSGFVNGENLLSLTTIATLTTSATAASSVTESPYAITASGAASANYAFIYIPGSLTVTPAPLTITAVNQTKQYGALVPPLTASYTGFVNGDTPISLTTLPTLTTTATTASSVAGGPYAITASGAASANYTMIYAPGNLTVTAAPLTITADNQIKVYGTALPALTATYTGFVNGDTQASLITPPTLTTTATAASTVAGSPYSITASGAAVNTNYAITYAPGTLSVTAAPLTITADNQTKTYGAALPVLTVSYSGFVNNDTQASLTTTPTLTTTATAVSTVAGSPYTITASGTAVNTNYTITYVPGALSVTGAPLTITASNLTKVYGAALPALTATYSGFVNGDTQTVLTTQPVFTTAATAASTVAGGPYAITASGAASANYTITYAPANLTVTAAPLTITADNQTKTYGAALPVLTASYTGLVNGDTQASLITQPVFTTAATAASTVAGSPYSITASGAVNTNYTISYVAGALSVTAAPLTITADNQTKTYGAALPVLTASYSGFVNSDTQASLTTPPILTTTATAASSITGSPYTITARGAVSPNYTITYVPGSLSVTAAVLTITADNQTKVYGAALPVLTASYSGFVNGDTRTVLTTQPVFTTAATAASTVAGGPYAITVSGAASANYTIMYAPGNLTVTGAPLTITADNQTKTYGAALPVLTASYSGLVNGDTQASLITQPVFTTAATAASTVAGSPYSITASGAVNTNYTISYVAGALSVTAAPLTITADNQTKAYGAALPVLTASYSGFVNSDTQASLTTPPILTTTATAASSITGSPYTITARGAVSPNYTITYVPGSLSVTAAVLTITADNQTKVYGAALPVLTASYSGFVNGDTRTVLTTQPVFTTAATATSTVAGGPYAITASGAASANYTIIYVPGNLAVTAAPLTITANNQTKVYGAALPALTTSYSGFVNGDTESNLTTKPSLTTTATTTSSIGGNPYPITASGAVSTNYTITYIPGNLTINALAITVTADAKSKTYGTADPALTYTITNGTLAGTDSFTGTLTRAPGESVNTYAITQGTLALNSNYVLSYTGANLTIIKRVLTITADNKNKVYGSANPAFTVNYAGFLNGDNQSVLTAQPVISTTSVTGSGVNTYPITVSGAATPNYDIVYVPGTLTVNKAALTITADSKTRTYGLNNPQFTVSYSGFVNGDNAAALSVQPVATSIASATSAPGNYPVTVNGAASDNYSFSYVNGTLTIIAVNGSSVSNLTVSSGTLSPAFAPATRSYTTSVDNLTSNISFTVTFDPTATASINGTTLANGSPSTGIPLNVGNNTISIVVRAQDGITTNIYTVVVYRGEPAAAITASNILSPNGDGKNDTWVIKDISLYPKNTVTIYDRAGRKVYTKQGYDDSWDGTLKGAPLTQGTYYYTVDLGPGLPKFRGFITLLRGN